jgi:hypothetical protein
MFRGIAHENQLVEVQRMWCWLRLQGVPSKTLQKAVYGAELEEAQTAAM